MAVKKKLITKNRFLAGFAAIVALLALVRLVFPQVAAERRPAEPSSTNVQSAETEAVQDESREAALETDVVKDESQASASVEQSSVVTASRFFDAQGQPVKHRIFGVTSYLEAFPDSQQVQIQSAMKWGVSSVYNREEAEERKQELVYIGASPYYHVDRMYRSIPYLVPRAAALLNDMGRAYYDSLQLKGIPLHQFIVTSVLRTKEDVEKLRRYNGNATENSCHLYGTTFDICYNRYHTVAPPGERRRLVRDDSLKYVLCEVLRDMRRDGRCHIKYEVKQSCFHITVR